MANFSKSRESKNVQVVTKENKRQLEIESGLAKKEFMKKYPDWDKNLEKHKHYDAQVKKAKNSENLKKPTKVAEQPMRSKEYYEKVGIDGDNPGLNLRYKNQYRKDFVANDPTPQKGFQKNKNGDAKFFPVKTKNDK